MSRWLPDRDVTGAWSRGAGGRGALQPRRARPLPSARPFSFAAKPYTAIELEPRTGGRWFERDADGVETQWGDVLEWEPPTRVLLAWRIAADWRFDPALETHLEIKFEAVEPNSTRVCLEHRELDRLGEAGRGMAEAMDSGWGSLLKRFVELAVDAEG